MRYIKSLYFYLLMYSIPYPLTRLQYFDHKLTNSPILPWLGSLVIEASDLRLNGHGFDPRPPHYRSLGSGMGDRLRAGIPPRYVNSHPGHSISTLPDASALLSTDQSSGTGFRPLSTTLNCRWIVSVESCKTFYFRSAIFVTRCDRDGRRL